MNLRTAAQCFVRGTQGRIISQGLIKWVGLVKIIIGGRGVGADQVVIAVGSDSTRHHILAGILITAGAGKALFVAIIDNWHATGKVHQRVGQLITGQLFFIVQAAVVDVEEIAKAAHIVVADKGRESVGVAVSINVIVIIFKERL